MANPHPKIPPNKENSKNSGGSAATTLSINKPSEQKEREREREREREGERGRCDFEIEKQNYIVKKTRK